MAEEPISRDELRDIVRDTMKETASDMLVTLGINVKEPLEQQKDFAFLHDMRTGSDTVKRHAITTGIGALVLGIITVVWFSMTGQKLPGQP